MEFKGTKGKWSVVSIINNEVNVRTDAGYICFLIKPTHYSNQDARFKKEMEEYNADAKLIAAAPELLKALIEIEKCTTKGQFADAVILSIKAINKAT